MLLFVNVCRHCHYQNVVPNVTSYTMQLTLNETAARLGKSVRQIRYMITQNRLPAQRDGKRWLVNEDDLPESAAQNRVGKKRRQRFERKSEHNLAPPPQGDSKSYSVLQLRAFNLTAPIYHRAVDIFGPEHRVVEHLEESLLSLATGCHRFGRSDKAAAYHEARDLAARAICLAILTEDPDAIEIAEAIEQDFMPALAGLLRRNEVRSR